jgi:hypothetical protein
MARQFRLALIRDSGVGRGMANAEPEASDLPAIAGFRKRLAAAIGAGQAVVTERVAAGRAAVNDRLTERKRNELLKDLGAVYYRSLGAGPGAAPDPDELNPIIDALNDLDVDDA